jgi:hypothetical protein
MELQDLFFESSQNQAKGDYQTAIVQLNQLLLAKPDFAPAWNNRAAMLQKLGHPFDAIMNYDRAIALSPDSAEFYNNRGAAFLDLEMFDAGLECFEQAILRNPNFGEPYSNCGNALMRLGRIEGAVEAYRKAVKADLTYADGHVGLSFALLKLGQFEEGWKEFEWRWKNKQMEPRGLKIPEWDGSPAVSIEDGLLIYSEQGMGDALQFMRYAPIIKKLAWHGKVYIEVRHPLTRIAQTMKGIDGVITLGEKLPPNITAAAPMMSVPRLFWSTFDAVPSRCPYLYGDEHRGSLWREKLTALPPGMLVGICWAGMNRENNPIASSVDSRRSMKLADFSNLAKIKGISWVSLQTGVPSSQVMRPPSGMFIGDWSSELFDFYDTAALIEQLDLVITVDTSVAHLAGALRKPVWMLSRFDGCWRWLVNQERSPWYPTMRIYNQKEAGNWSEPLNRIHADLSALVEVH